MPPLDWGRVMGANAEALREDVDAADDMYELLEMGSVSPNSEEAVDANKMIKLFEVTKAVMKVKSLQAEVALEEIAKNGGGEREQELMDKIAHLEGELQRYRALEQELNEKEEAFFQEQNKNDELVGRLDAAERENKSLKRDLDRGKKDMRDLH